MFLAVVYKMLQNIPGLIFFILGLLVVFFAIKRKKNTSFNQFQLIIGLVVAVLSLLTNSIMVWFMIVFAILFLGLKGVESSGASIFEHMNLGPWRDKEIKIIETVEPEMKSGRRFKREWFGNQRIGANVYEWDDINFSVLSGDTLIDLGNTILPKTDNVILIRKGFGRTRIIVPVGTSIMLEHSAMSGKVMFEGNVYKLKNESIKMYNSQYDDNSRKLKIVTSTLIGDIEVIQI